MKKFDKNIVMKLLEVSTVEIKGLYKHITVHN
jgi:hypothetical protein